MKKPRDNKTKNLHPRNLHNQGYDYPALASTQPALKPFVHPNQHGNQSIDFADPNAVKALNTALLKHHYQIQNWDIPPGYLCPPIPGRADYIHHVADLLDSNDQHIKMLDIGTGANGIYALLASRIYNWNCTASDIDPASLKNVAKILTQNPDLEHHIQLRHQPDNSHIFKHIIQPGETYHLSVCNPPFHASPEEAQKANQKKRTNLNQTTTTEPTLNFGGQKAELWCNGGEIRFLRKMIKESKHYAQQCRWFTTLISKSENLAPSQKLLKKLQATQTKEIQMNQGKKITRILAWTFST